MNVRLDQKQETRKRIVDSATKAIRERGLDDPSVGEVMAAAGLTVGGFYAHFENKDALMLEALRNMMLHRMDELYATIPATNASERRTLAARYYLSRKHRDGEIDRCPLPAVLGELNRLDPRYREVVAEHIETWAKAMAEDDADGRRRALAAISTMVGALTLARALGPTPFSDEVLAAAKAAVA
jgi:TetR/AcrR family transcriptional repressor of nem operon